MYRPILRQHEVSPKIPKFELTIEQDYEYWSNFLKWKTERNTFLLNCKSKFICKNYFSKKELLFYHDVLSRKSGYPSTPESFQEFLGRPYILEKFQEESDSVLDFEPIS
jgi:hypothetical protein